MEVADNLKLIINGQGPEPIARMYVSGGTTRLIEILKRISKKERVNLYVISSQSVCNTFIKNGINAKYRVIPSFIENTSSYSMLLLDSVFRVIRVCLSRLSTNKGTLYASSDFLWDVFPAFVWKLRNKNLKWVQVIHHLIPPPLKRKGSFSINFISFCSQRISLFFIKRYCDSIIVINPFTKEILKGNGFDERKINVSLNCVDMECLKEIKPNNEIKYDGIFLGRLHPSKGVFDLIEIWKIVCEKIKPAKLLIIGSGAKKVEERLKRKVQESGLNDNIDILGYVHDKERFGIVKSCRVFVFPSHEEGFGIAPMEAMACGVPVVAYNLPVYKEVFEDKLMTVPLGDVGAMAEQVVFLLENPKIAKKIGQEGKEFVKIYSDWRKVAEKDLSAIINLIYYKKAS